MVEFALQFMDKSFLFKENVKWLKRTWKDYLIHTRAEDGVSLLVPLQCKYGSFVLPQSAGQIS